MSSSIEMRIAYNDTNSEMCNELICIDGMYECYYATSVNNIMNILHQETRYSMCYQLLYEDVLKCEIV